MYYHKFEVARTKFSEARNHAKKNGFNSLLERAEKQLRVLNILSTHNQIQTLVQNSYTENELKTSSIREAIAYLTDLGDLLSNQSGKGSRESKE